MSMKRPVSGLLAAVFLSFCLPLLAKDEGLNKATVTQPDSPPDEPVRPPVEDALGRFEETSRALAAAIRSSGTGRSEPPPSIEESTLLAADPDDDGFSNRDELVWRSNPHDSSSRPEAWTKVLFAGVDSEQVQLTFTGRDTKGRAIFNSAAASPGELKSRPIGPTKTYTPGETLMVTRYRPGFAVTYEQEVTPFRLVDFKKVKRENPQVVMADGKAKIEEVDIAVLEDMSGDKPIVELEAGKPQICTFALVSLVDTRPGGSAIRIRSGESFDLGDNERYKLVDVSEEHATIETLGSGDRHVIPKAATPAPQPTPEEVQIQ